MSMDTKSKKQDLTHASLGKALADAATFGPLDVVPPDETCDDCGRGSEELIAVGIRMREYWNEGDPSVGIDGHYAPLCDECAKRRGFE